MPYPQNIDAANYLVEAPAYDFDSSNFLYRDPCDLLIADEEADNLEHLFELLAA